MYSTLPIWAARSSAAAALFLLTAEAPAAPVNITFSSTAGSAITAGSRLTVTVSLNDAVAFNTLDATLTWDNLYLAPADQVSANPFLSLGSVFTGTGFAPASYGSSAGTSTITIALFSLTDPAELANGPGSLFRLDFYVRTGVTLPPSTLLSFGSLGGPGQALEGVGLALQTVFDANGDVIDPQPDPLTATPSALAIGLVPEPNAGLLCLLAMAGLPAIRARRRSN